MKTKGTNMKAAQIGKANSKDKNDTKEYKLQRNNRNNKCVKK